MLKKILIIVLILFTCLLGGCSKDYEKIYNEIKNMELEDAFESEEEIQAFFEEVQENYNYKLNFKVKAKRFSQGEKYEGSDRETYKYKQEMTVKFQKENNKLIVKDKKVEKSSKNGTKKENCIYYYDNNQEYIHNRSNNEKYSNHISAYSYEEIMNCHLNKAFYRDFFIELYEKGFIERIGKDKHGNIVVIANCNNRSNRTEIDKFIFKDKQIIEYEYIGIGENRGFKSIWHHTEKYSYGKNTIRYPDFSEYKNRGWW